MQAMTAAPPTDERRSSRHTPGPWHRNIRPATKYPTVFAGRNTHVAHVATNRLSAEEVEANLALIAAAPELLEAARAMMAMADPGGEATDIWAVSMRAAIAKAEG